MARSQLFSWLRLIIPALCVGVIGSALWLAVEHTQGTLAGWVLLVTVLGTAAAIAAGADIPARAAGRQYKLGGIGAVLFAMILLVAWVVLLEAGASSAAATALVAASWAAFWGLLAWALRRQGAGVRGALPLGLASLGMALPVAAVPLIHWAGHWGADGSGVSAWQGRVVAVVAHACPFFPLLRGLKPAVRLDWGAFPGMYAWSGLGQEVPLELPNPWVCGAIYAGLAGAVWLVGRGTASVAIE